VRFTCGVNDQRTVHDSLFGLTITNAKVCRLPAASGTVVGLRVALPAPARRGLLQSWASS
jgi:hypothetical protein